MPQVEEREGQHAEGELGRRRVKKPATPTLSILKELNCLGERKKSFGEYISEDFQRRYASAVVELSQLNRDLNEHLENIAEFTQQVNSTALLCLPFI